MRRLLCGWFVIGFIAVITPVRAQDVPPPAPYVYALLSSLAYEPVTSPNILELTRLGWRRYTMSRHDGTNDASGYFGLAYLNDETCQLIIAHRGTDEIVTLKDLDDDLHLSLGVAPEQFRSAVLFIERVRLMIVDEEPCGESYTLSFTGHSLGGALAELSAAWWEYEFTTAVTFDSPGVQYIEDAASRITSYLAAPNVVNTANAHVGKIILMDVDANALRGNSYSHGFCWFNFQRSCYMRYSLQSHSMARILGAFDPETQQLKVEGIGVMWWPHGWQAGLQQFMCPNDLRVPRGTVEYPIYDSVWCDVPFNR